MAKPSVGQPTGDSPTVVLTVDGQEITDPKEIITYVTENLVPQEESAANDSADPAFDNYLSGKTPVRSWN